MASDASSFGAAEEEKSPISTFNDQKAQCMALGTEAKDCIARLERLEKSLKPTPLPRAPKAAASRQTRPQKSGFDLDAEIAKAKKALAEHTADNQKAKARFSAMEESLSKGDAHLNKLSVIAATEDLHE
mmetsp:Transcript_5265/g.12061  ORF Transcript_5265/g.12061 Transcript_5265/m.12061 type:complete len:129 (-) Transcript_5265:474-860(-)